MTFANEDARTIAQCDTVLVMATVPETFARTLYKDQAMVLTKVPEISPVVEFGPRFVN
jgi:hypothetical protein